MAVKCSIGEIFCFRDYQLTVSEAKVVGLLLLSVAVQIKASKQNSKPGFAL